MPNKTANLSGLLSTGSGTGNIKYLKSRGWLQSDLPEIQPDRHEYTVHNLVTGLDSKRNITQTDAVYIPYAGPNERITVKLKVKGETTPDSAHPEWTAFNIMISNMNSDHSQVDTVDHVANKYSVLLSTGQVLFTTDPTKIEEGLVDFTTEYALAQKGFPNPVNKQDQLTDYARDVNFMLERAVLTRKKKAFVYIPTGEEMVKIDDNLYVFARWTAGPLSEDTEMLIENYSSKMIGFNVATLVTVFGTYSVTSTYQDVQNDTELPSAKGVWTTDQSLIPFASPDLHIKSVGAFVGRADNGILKWSEVDPASVGVTAVLEVSDADGTIVSTTGGAYTSKIGQKVRVILTVNTTQPVQIRTITVEGLYDPSIYNQPIDPTPVGPGAVIEIGEIAKGWPMPYEFRAAVPTGTQRIMRHPTMSAGSMVVNQDGGQCTWESKLFLRVPSDSRTLYWNPGGAGSVPNPLPANYDLRTALSWGQFEVKGKNRNIPSDIEDSSSLRTGFTGIPVYTPSISISVGGADVTKDLVSAGGLSVSLFGEKNVATSAPSPGDDFVITLDGNVIEWGKMVSYTASGTHEGIQIDIGAIDPLDYHNLDLDTLDTSTVPNAYKDLAGFANAVASSAGLTLAFGGATLPGDQTENIDDQYDFYGGTVTQELELVANMAKGTLYSHAPSQTIRIAKFDSVGGAVSKGKLCPFITTGFNLSEGYGVVEVTGISNTIRTTTKVVPATFVNNGTPENYIGIIRDMGGALMNQEQSGWFPSEPVNGLDYIQFGTTNSDKGVMVMPFPLRFAWQRIGYDKDQIEKLMGLVLGHDYIDMDSGMPGLPKLGSNNMLTDWWVVSHINPTGFGRNPNLPIGSKGSGYIRIKSILFKIETPAQLRQRYGLEDWEVPDSFGPCVVGFKCFVEDMGGFGMNVEFRLSFSGVGLDATNIGIKPFICKASSAPAGKLPNKKVTVQNPFLVQERPKEGENAEEFDPEASAAYALGVEIATGLTHWEALKRHQGEVKYLGGVSGEVGGTAEGMTIVENPRAVIAPGDACWTVFKVAGGI